MSPIHFNLNQDDHSSSPFLHLHPHEVVDEDVTLGRKQDIHDLKFTILKRYNHHQYGNDHYHNVTSSSSSSAKCESQKMRLYQKYMKSNDDDKTIEDQNLKQDGSPRESCGENSTNNIRICADCGTTKTPLWRSGPHGPKSVCNACGIRQRKARRAAMAASDGACATSSNATTKFNLLHKDMGASPKTNKRSKNGTKKPLKPNDQTKKICFQEFALNLSNKLSLNQLFPQDEKEAAILLMALSSGFVEG